jgi:pimeloyl-ACP methyl ester carboxylesterase
VLEAPCPAEARALQRGVLCGYLRVPLDRAKPGGRMIRIYFERYPRRDRSQRRLSTVVSIQGGPGYPTAADRAGRVALWRPVAARRALLLMDLRGTGLSGALACRAFARSSRGYIARAGRCAAQLGPRRDLYSTAQAVEDLEAVLAVFRMRKIDLYGDSYGSYAAQAYALRHPERLRSLALDSTYFLPGTDPALADLVDAIRRGLRLTCARRPACPAGGDPVELVTRFASRVRARPIRGFAPDGDGTRTRVRLNEDAYVQAVSSGYYYPALWRDLPAAILAARNGDPKPMLRLAAETVTIDAPTTDPAESSEALYLAVICHDYPQLWDPATPLAARPAEARSRLAAYPSGTFTPFSVAAWTQTDYEGVLACLRWPSPFRPDPPDPPGAVYPRVPTLVLNGDLDTITASSGAREVADRFPGSTFVELQNSFHVLALYDRDRCASRIYVHFVRTLRAGDTSCAERVPEVRVLETFPRRLTRTKPAEAAPGDGSTVRDRRLAATAALTVSDVINRWFVNYDGTSVGLRGGRWSYSGDDPVAFALKNVRFVRRVPVSGTARWSPTGGRVRARVRVRGPFGRTGTLRLRWSLGVPLARASLKGEVGGRPLRATMLAP